jgi:hypothetical protein
MITTAELELNHPRLSKTNDTIEVLTAVIENSVKAIVVVFRGILISCN